MHAWFQGPNTEINIGNHSELGLETDCPCSSPCVDLGIVCTSDGQLHKLCHWKHSRPHDGVMTWKHFPNYWPFVWGIHQWRVDSPHIGPVTCSFWCFLWCMSEQMFTLKKCTYDQRDNSLLERPAARLTNYGFKSFKSYGAKIWNLLLATYKMGLSFDTFKNMIKTWSGPTCKCSVCCLFTTWLSNHIHV